MNHGINVVVFPVKDLDQAKAFYGTLLGVEPYADQPYYVGFRIADEEVGLDPNGHGKGMTGPVTYWHVDDINGSLQSLLAAGAQTQDTVREVGGRLIATVKDADGNVVGLLQEP
jgi:predicted enzyme related to lactoylglutathione lyase